MVRNLGRAFVAVAVTLPMVLGVGACKSGNAAQRLAESTAPTLDGSTNKCKVGGEASKSLVVEWPMGDRAALEGKVQDRLVAVRYRNCEMELINNCSVAGNYRYISVTPKSENIHITNADELYAKIPIGAVKLEGQLARDGALNVDMILVGRHESDCFRFQSSELDGRCEGATHIVTGLSVGAFVFYSGAAADIGAGVDVKGTGVGVGAGSSASRELLSRDGDLAACVQPVGTEPITRPPPGCGALLQVEVVPIDIPEVATSTSSTAVGQLTNTNKIAGENLTTDNLDRQIKVAGGVALASYAVALGGVFAFVIGFKMNSTYSADTDPSTIGAAGTPDRAKYISRYNTSLGLLYGGLGGAVLGLTVGLAASVWGRKLRNERSTRLAGVDFAPIPGGAMLGTMWRF